MLFVPVSQILNRTESSQVDPDQSGLASTVDPDQSGSASTDGGMVHMDDSGFADDLTGGVNNHTFIAKKIGFKDNISKI